MSDNFREILETFDNTYPQRQYEIKIECPEFTSVCPKTGHPDFGKLTFTYIPASKCVELKSLKLYLQKFRNEGIFYENVTNRILDDVAGITEPHEMTLVAEWTPRGGVSSTITCRYKAAT